MEKDSDTVPDFHKKLYKLIADLKKEMVKKSNGQEMGEVLDKEKYKMLMAEYRKFKTMNVKHFKFNSAQLIVSD